MGKFLESPIAIDRTKLIRAATVTSPAPPPTAHDDHGQPHNSHPSTLHTIHCPARHASFRLSECVDPVAPYGAFFWVCFVPPRPHCDPAHCIHITPKQASG